MKTVIRMIAVMVFLSACSPLTPVVPSPVPNTPSPTSTPTQTPIPPTETPVPTPTEMTDPETGWKIQIVNGESQLFSPDIKEWVVLGGTVPLIEHDERPYTTLEDAFQMELYYKAGFSGPKISENPNVDINNIIDFTGLFQDKLAVREYGNYSKLPANFQEKLKNGDFKYAFTAPQGEYSFEVSSTSKYRVYVMPYADMGNYPGYQPLGDTATNKKFGVLTKSDGKNVISITSFDYPLANLKKTTFMKMILYSLACVMDPNQKVGLYTSPIQFRPEYLESFVDPKFTGVFIVENKQ
jgi:hypothetical protein